MAEREWEKFFTADDFNFDVTIEGHQGCDPEPRHLADRANAILREALEKAPKVFDNDETMTTCGWQPKLGDTHSGRIVCIKKIEKGGGG